jgi:hypothetical protein
MFRKPYTRFILSTVVMVRANPINTIATAVKKPGLTKILPLAPVSRVIVCAYSMMAKNRGAVPTRSRKSPIFLGV